MTETLYYLTQFTSETLTISGFLLLLVLSLLVTFWFYNRKKFHQLSHQIPASVVKNYIDSIIQNSNSLKSSLFRGGGIELGNGIPSVMPINTLPTGTPVSVSGGGEELQQKNAEIASLHAKLAEKNRIVSDLEKRISELDKKGNSGGEEVAIYKSEVEKLQKKIEALQSELASASANKGGGGDAETKKQLESVTKERDELKERLKEYEIIEEDLANLKRLQQENEKLKKSLEAMGGAVAPAAAATATASAAPANPPAAAAEAPAVQEKVELPSPEAAVASAEDNAAIAAADADAGPAKVDEVQAQNAGDQKSAEELLSEFEKMLG